MKKLSINLQQEYKTFEVGFQYEFEAADNLIVISGINGSGKSQLGEIIREVNNVQIDGKPVSNIVYEGINESIANCYQYRRIII